MAAVVGNGGWTYEVVPDWGRSAARPELGLVSGVACDREDNVYVFQRTPEALMLVFDRDGALLRTWGQGEFRHPHGVFATADGAVLVTDRDLHQMLRYAPTGERLAAWGTAGRPGAPGQPFNQPARAAAAESGEMFVADGYGQHRVHRFSPGGELIGSWGRAGTGAGEFGWPVHAVCLDPRGRVLVADRGNGRIQHFTPDGAYLGEWGGLRAPQDVCITAEREVFIAEGAGPAITIVDLDGNVLGRWGERGDGPGQFAASPHSLWVDSRGDLYVGEVTTPNRFQKFVRR